MILGLFLETLRTGKDNILVTLTQGKSNEISPISSLCDPVLGWLTIIRLDRDRAMCTHTLSYNDGASRVSN